MKLFAEGFGGELLPVSFDKENKILIGACGPVGFNAPIVVATGDTDIEISECYWTLGQLRSFGYTRVRAQLEDNSPGSGIFKGK